MNVGIAFLIGPRQVRALLPGPEAAAPAGTPAGTHTVTVVRHGVESQIDTEKVEVGDIVIVRPGEKITAIPWSTGMME